MTTPQAARAPGQKTVVSLIGVGHCYSHLTTVALAPIFPLMREALGLSYVALGSLVAVYGITTSASQIPVGILVDRHGGRLILVLGLLCLGGAFAFAGIATDYWHLLVLMGIAGLGNSVFHPADYAILANRVDEAYLGRVVSLHSFLGYVGWAIAPPLVLGLSALFDWRGALLGVGVIGIAIAVLVHWRGAVIDDEAPAQATKARPARRPFNLRRDLGVMLSRPMIAMFLFFALTSMTIIGVTTFLAVSVMELFAVDEEAGNFALTAFLVAMAGGVLLGGIVADRTLDRGRMTALTIGLAALLMAVFALAPGGYILGVAVIGASGFLLGISSPSRDLLVRASAPPDAIGLAFGFTSTGIGVGFVLGPLSVGWLMDLHRPDIGLIVLAASSALAVLTVLPSGRPARA